MCALQSAGIDVYGVDLSEFLLGEAVRAGLAGRVVCGDMRALPFADGAFGSAINMFTSFGYFDDDDNARALNEIARVVGAAGVFVIDFINGRRVRARMQPASRRRVNDAMVEERRDLSADGRVLTKQVEVRWPDRDPVRYTERLRLYTHAELSGMLAGAGFRVREVHGDYELSAFEETESERLIMVCERLENR
jgi:SAM-dependent methyltransferase